MKPKKTSRSNGKRSDQKFSNSVFACSPGPNKQYKKTTQSHKDPVLLNIDSAKRYKQLNKIAAGKEQLKHIIGKLQIQQNSKQQHHIRNKNNDLFLCYNKNPFFPLTPLKVQENRKEITPEKKKKQGQITIFEGLRRLSERSDMKKIMTRLKQFEVPSDQQKFLQKKQGPLLTKLKIGTPEVQVEHLASFAEQGITLESEFDFLDRLVARKDENEMFAKLQKNKLNIFHFLKHPQAPDYYSTQQQLDKLNYCKNSIIKSILNMGDECLYRDISTIGRLLIKGKSKKVIDSQHILRPDDLIANLDKIYFQDLMMITSGRLQSSVLKQYLQKEYIYKDDREKLIINDVKMGTIEASAVKVKSALSIFDKGIHKSTLYSIDDFDKYQGKIHKSLPPNHAELLQLVGSNEDKQLFQELMQLKQLLIKYQIRDSKAMQNIDNRISNHFKRLVAKLDQGNGIQIQQKISKNKKHIDRSENMRIESLTSETKEKKGYDQKIQEFTFKKQHQRHKSKDIVPSKKYKKSMSPHSKSVWI